MTAHRRQSHYFEYLRHAVAYRGRGSERKIDYAEFRAEQLSRLAAHELTRARDLERGLFYDVRNRRKVGALALFKRGRNYSGSGNADVDRRFAFAQSGERSRHERIVLNRVGEYDELCAAYRVPVRRAFG